MKSVYCAALMCLGLAAGAQASAFNSPVSLSYIPGDQVSHYDVSCANGLSYELLRSEGQWCIAGADADHCESKKVSAAAKACRLGKYIVSAESPVAQSVAAVSH
ncbi:hypothetical protein [Spongiibacter sp.]|uniref:hypothetical protein n=1 Tax=Spongiibacter sp. TaxID=2024860 RepID=UPI0035665C7B